ncbi:MAG TPA: spore coat associated protein CotJA [Halanaerobiales bacterium]|nr:spore coat associated protein CotJA [Halanaerobiales bacterium]
MDSKKQSYPCPGPDRMKLAHAYIPYQEFREAYSPEQALRRGTLFPELWMPYQPGRVRGAY